MLSGYQTRLHPVNESHLALLRKWRNSLHVRQFMLNADIISEKQQMQWFESLATRYSERHFVIEYKAELIGSCNIKTYPVSADINNKEVFNSANEYELGLYIGEKQYLGNVIAFSPTLLMNDYCFDVLHADRLRAVVKPENAAALRYNQKLGYKVVDEGSLVTLTLTKGDYQSASSILKRLLGRIPRK